MKSIRTIFENNHLINIIFYLILFLQIGVLIIFAVNKSGYNIDEIYSYILSNSYDADRISNADWLYDEWVDGDQLVDFITVQDGEQFAYTKTYMNNTTDCHPPLYYILLHTICSLFPNTFSKWFGIILNIIAFIITQIFLYKTSKLIFNNSLWSVIPVFVYGATQAFIDSNMFIRMYMLLTMFTVIFIYIHCLMLKKGIKTYHFLLCFIVTFLGIFTQYYFAITAFFVAGAFCLYLLKQKKYKELLIYASLMLFAVALVFIAYPAAITQITGSETNNIGNDLSSNILNFSMFFKRLYSMVKQLLSAAVVGLWSVKWIIGLVLIAIISLLIIRKKCTAKSIDKQNKTILIVATIIFAIVIVVISHLSGKLDHLRYIYNIIPILSIVVTMWIELLTYKLKLNINITVVGVMVICVLSTIGLVVGKHCSFLYVDQHKEIEEVSELIKSHPVVVLSPKTQIFPTGNLMYFVKADDLYMSTSNDISNIDSIFTDEDVENGFVVFINTDTDWCEGYDCKETLDRISESSSYSITWEEIETCRFGEIIFANVE